MDEMHFLKSSTAKWAKRMPTISAQSLIGLTGSPINNSMAELLQLLKVLQGNHEEQLTLENLPEITLRRLKTDKSPHSDQYLLHPTPGNAYC